MSPCREARVKDGPRLDALVHSSKLPWRRKHWHLFHGLACVLSTSSARFLHSANNTSCGQARLARQGSLQHGRQPALAYHCGPSPPQPLWRALSDPRVGLARRLHVLARRPNLPLPAATAIIVIVTSNSAPWGGALVLALHHALHLPLPLVLHTGGGRRTASTKRQGKRQHGMHCVQPHWLARQRLAGTW